MKITATAPPKRNKLDIQAPTELCRKLELRATNPEEDRLLAMLNCVLTDTVCLKHSGNMVRLYNFLATQLPATSTNTTF